jgi:hypothetical protein
MDRLYDSYSHFQAGVQCIIIHCQGNGCGICLCGDKYIV